MASYNDPIPNTGIEWLDQRVFGTTNYNNWIRNITNNYGYKIETVNQPNSGFRADIDPLTRVIRVNEADFRYLDLLHESRHFAQLRNLQRFNINLSDLKIKHSQAIMGYLEYDAYMYELRISESSIARYGVGFQQDYINWIERQLYDNDTGYYNRGIQNRIQGSTREIINHIWDRR